MEQIRKPAYWSAPVPPELRPAATVADADLRATFDYWLRLKGSRKMPARNEISAKYLKHGLRTVHIYDVVGDGEDFRMRLIGTGVFPGLDEDQTGKLLSEHPDPGVRLRFAIALKHVVETGEPVRSLSLRQTGDLLRDQRTEGIWLPLGTDDRVEHVLAQSTLKVVTPGSPGFGAKPGESPA